MTLLLTAFLIQKISIKKPPVRLGRRTEWRLMTVWASWESVWDAPDMLGISKKKLAS
jgi:hypothetical protein